MGENERLPESAEPLPNGILPGAGPVMRALDSDRWLRAEERTADLIACIQPNQLSEERRNAVANYVQELIMKCFPCQVCTFGSVPLKTYLPDGDIDLTAFSHDQNLKDTWANLVRDMLENEEKNENAEFHVKEVQYIQAEVKIIKCLVENIVVDISFNQVGGLCTLCFLDEIDNLIDQNHLFKRSIILVKAWCYYESRILGAHHGLISTYALETLVLYIFHVFNNSFQGPLEVLYRFLEFFSKFDWDNFCVSLWGPVPISSLPDVTADPPRKDSGELLLSKNFLESCSIAYSVFPGGQENSGQPFVSKHFNVIDPLRVSNNLGRSVSKGNFFRIRSAFAFGAKRLARLLDCPKDNLIFEVNQFFTNTWERHGSGQRPDAAGDVLSQKRLSTPDDLSDFRNSNNMGGSNVNANSVVHEKEDRGSHGRSVSSQHGGIAATVMPAREVSAASHIQNLKSKNPNMLQIPDRLGRKNVSAKVSVSNETQKDLKVDHLASIPQGRFLFARTHSSPELTDAYGYVLSQSQHNRQSETAYPHGTCSNTDANNRKKYHGSESLGSHVNHSSVTDTSSMRNASSLDTYATDSSHALNTYLKDLGSNAFSKEFYANSEAQDGQLENQDIVNMMASASLQGYDGQFHVPSHINAAHVPFSIPPSFLTSMGYAQQNLSGLFPSHIPLINPSFTNLQFSHGLVSPQLQQYFHGFRVNSPSENSFEQSNDNFDSMEVNLEEVDNDIWKEQDVCSSSGCDPENGNFEMLQSDDKQPGLMSGAKYVPPCRASSSANSMRSQQKNLRGKRGSRRQGTDNFPIQDDRSGDACAEETSASSRFSSATCSNSLRSRTSSESSWEESSTKSSKEKCGKKIASADLSTSHGKGKKMSEHLVLETEDDDQKSVVLSNNRTEMVEGHSELEPGVSLQAPRLNDFEAAQTNGMDSMISLPQMLIDPGLRQKMNDDSGLVPFYPAGPPVPFVAMLRYIPPEKGNSDPSIGYYGGVETLTNREPVHDYSHVEYYNSDSSSSFKEKSATKTSERKTSDILHSDFASHWQNLLVGRSCQDSRFHGPLLYPSPVMVPPAYLQGRFPYENAGRPLLTNTNIFPQLMTSYGNRFVPVTPLQSVSNRPLNVYQRYVDEIPRARSGTGTYLPNPVSGRERHSTGTRKGSYNHDRNGMYGDREGNWNANSKSRAAGRNHNRSHNDRSSMRVNRSTSSDSQPDNSWVSFRHESFPYQTQNGLLNSNSNMDGTQNMAYGMFPLAPTNPLGVSNGPSVPPVVVWYPFDHNAAYGFNGEQLEFGSLGPVDLPGVDENSHLNEGTASRTLQDHGRNGNTRHQSSPDQPPSPYHKRT
ncbi:uncharacterized protein LOC127252696 isoform X2 [Andrographis paniculata]|uniref:uncharacterized protein LOC127252696 isoform X2 n=1 Tax=Andrographis paniculata TaxID=175694 RepID=UPI0021E70222|nr:uncharacterized protein LOC127252696 isoform X2 [Andrographis paniculata]